MATELPPPADNDRHWILQAGPLKVGIIGAGMSGLYSALMLESLGIKYEIFEESDRMGGRLFTYHFEKGGKYDYFVGNAFMYYNGIRARANNDKGQNFGWDKLGVGEKYLKATVKAILYDVMGPYAAELTRDLVVGGKKGWEMLMTMNAYSGRGYMSTKYIPSPNLGIPDTHLPTDVVNWCETFADSTGSYDRSFSDTVLGAMDFGVDQATPVDWKCLDVERYLRGKGGEIHLNHRATSIAFNEDSQKVEVGIRVDGETMILPFDHVISTLPLPCMRMLDLQNSGMDDAQENALRQLTYGPSTKVGMLFKSAWWSTWMDLDGNPINLFGGESPRAYGCVPVRFGALMGTGKQEYEDQIKALVLRDLALLHNVDLELLKNHYVEHFAWDWHHPRSMGAFAFFGPGMFEKPYQSLNLPTKNGRLHFASEALSVRHAWVVGALDSAWHAVKEVLVVVYGPKSKQVHDFHKKWGYNQEWTRIPEGATEPRAPNQDEPEGDDDLGDDLFLRHLLFNRPEVFE
ncbi:hypothetical protein BD779DRAFT_1698051 [Infundibulicybe gibba]|nr:hypothetical protein BD779DRAFT_1698051 [Infundibulicybe gibba]